MWGWYLGNKEFLKDEIPRGPGFPKQYEDLVKGVRDISVGAGNYHCFIGGDGTVFSIMEFNYDGGEGLFC